MQGSLPSPSKEVGLTMVRFLPDSVETGWDSHGLTPLTLEEGARLGHGSPLLGKRACHCLLEKERGLATTLDLLPV